MSVSCLITKAGIGSLVMTWFLSVPPAGAREIHIPPGSKQGDGAQGPANSQQISADPRQGSVPQEPTATHQGTHSKHPFCDNYSSNLLSWVCQNKGFTRFLQWGLLEYADYWYELQWLIFYNCIDCFVHSGFLSAPNYKWLRCVLPVLKWIVKQFYLDLNLSLIVPAQLGKCELNPAVVFEGSCTIFVKLSLKFML